MNSQGNDMRRMISVAYGLWLAIGLALPGAAQAPAEVAVGQALPPGMAMPPAGHGSTPGIGSGPMTWGGVLSRSLMPSSPSAAVGAELVEAVRPVGDVPDDGVLLAQAPVVELFTSQGCAACPPADAYFGELARRDDVIALALHVDYWDYIGWADAFARNDFTKRQKAYARAAGSKVIYTPQAIVEGGEPMPGNDATAIAATVTSEGADAPAVRLRMLTSEGRRIVSAMPAPGLGDIIVQLVRYLPERTVTIERGENAGRTITYHNIVTEWTVLGRWDGQEKLRLELDLKGEEPAVLILQRAGHGPIVAASRLP